MPNSIKHFVVYSALCAAIFASAACSPKRIPPMTVSELMEDRVTLDGVMLKCNQNPSKARSDSDCLNARIAIERLAKDVDPAEEAKRNADFERRREQLRQAQEKVRVEQEARNRVDPYNLPVLPVAPTAGGASGTQPRP